MQRSLPFVVAALVVAAVAVPVAGMAAVGEPVPAADDTVAQTDTNSSNATVAPGERLSGVVGVQKAEVEGEVNRRAFGLQIANASTNASKASVIAGQFENIQQRLAALEQRKANLTEARQNGSISEGKYRAQVAELSARLDAARNLANETGEESAGLPADLLEARGVNATAIQTLQQRASELGGGEVAEIAREIGGAPDDVGREGRGNNGPESDLPETDNGGAADDSPDVPAGNATDGVDSTTDAVDNTTDTVDNTNTTEAVTDSTDNTTESSETVDDTTETVDDATTNTTDAVENATDGI